MNEPLIATYVVRINSGDPMDVTRAIESTGANMLLFQHGDAVGELAKFEDDLEQDAIERSLNE